MITTTNTACPREESALLTLRKTSVHADARRKAYYWLKPAIDFIAALILLAFALPVMLLAGLLVKATSRGPVLYSQTRVGRNGRLFRIYKIRTMYHNCEASSGAKWSSKKDARVTFIGRILRKTHVDELPQLWNILRGEMSLIGPRPERPEFVLYLEKAIDGYADRIRVKPGLTGLAQIQLPPDTNLQSVRNKLALDLVYVSRLGFWLDLRIMVGTVLHVIGCSYAAVRRMMRLPESAAIPTLILGGTEACPADKAVATAERESVVSQNYSEPKLSNV